MSGRKSNSHQQFGPITAKNRVNFVNLAAQTEHRNFLEKWAAIRKTKPPMEAGSDPPSPEKPLVQEGAFEHGGAVKSRLRDVLSANSEKVPVLLYSIFIVVCISATAFLVYQAKKGNAAASAAHSSIVQSYLRNQGSSGQVNSQKENWEIQMERVDPNWRQKTQDEQYRIAVKAGETAPVGNGMAGGTNPLDYVFALIGFGLLIKMMNGFRKMGSGQE